MNNKALRVADYLEHMLQAIERINRYTEAITEVVFLQNEQVQDAVIRNIEIIGEAAKNIERHASEYIGKHSDVPWEDMYQMRNQVAHGYFSVDMEIVWKTVERDIPQLEQQIKKLLQDVSADGYNKNPSGENN